MIAKLFSLCQTKFMKILKKIWWVILVFIVLGVLFCRPSLKTVFKAPQVSNSKIFSEKGTYEVTTQKVKYYEQVEGFLAKPVKEGVYPGVVMIHEQWGANDNIDDMAKLLASYGYSVLVADLFNGAVTKTPEDAQKLVGSLDQEKAILNLRVAADYLRKNESAPKIASLGWDFGGSQSLKLSLSGEKLNATIIYYGNLLLEAKKLRPITWPVLGIFGDKDVLVPVESARIFDNVLTKLNIPHEIQIYPGVGHGFANPSDTNYTPKETLDAWTKTVQFLEKNLK